MIAEANTATAVGVGGVAGLVLLMLAAFAKGVWPAITDWLHLRRQTEEQKETNRGTILALTQDAIVDFNGVLKDDNTRLRGELEAANKRIDALVSTVGSLTLELQVLRARVAELETP